MLKNKTLTKILSTLLSAQNGTDRVGQSHNLFFCVSSYPLLIESFWQQTGLMGFAEHTQCPLQPLEPTEKKNERKLALHLLISDPSTRTPVDQCINMSLKSSKSDVSSALGTCIPSQIKGKSKHLNYTSSLRTKTIYACFHCGKREANCTG